jgi:precorrin-2/cobalt-factor-2 C20-methyltransferase
MSGKLYGVGLGPGDPELVTLKAVRILQNVDVVVAPQGEKEGLAYQVVKPYLKQTVLFVPFTMEKTQVPVSLFHEAVEQVRGYLTEGKMVAFVTLGDPLLYSTFLTLWRSIPEAEVEVIPGVSSFQAAAAKLKFPLVQGRERLAILPGGDFPEEILECFQSLVIFKAAKNYDRLVERLKRWSFRGGAVVRLGFPEEVVHPEMEGLCGKELPYFSLLVARKADS